MSVKFNDFNKGYNKYNLFVNQENVKKAEAEETQKAKAKEIAFKGLECETDLLTQNMQAVLGIKMVQVTDENREIADTTNEILASLGVNYKVTPAQTASVANGMKNTVLPGMKLAQDGAVADNIADPNGPFADLFAQE